MDIEYKSRSKWGKEARSDKPQEPATMMMMLKLMRVMMVKIMMMVHDTIGHQYHKLQIKQQQEKNTIILSIFLHVDILHVHL